MLYSAAAGHAIQALSRLGMLCPTGFITLQGVCEGTQLPEPFIAKLFQQLVRRRLLKSAKGRGGGFALGRPAEQIRLRDIVEAIDGLGWLDVCIVGLVPCSSDEPCPVHDEWAPAQHDIKTYLARTTLAHMSDTVRRKLELLAGGPGAGPDHARCADSACPRAGSTGTSAPSARAPRPAWAATSRERGTPAMASSSEGAMPASAPESPGS